MVTRFHVYLTISSINGKISFQFQFWAHFFASRNTDIRLKIFPTALKKFALRADYRSSVNEVGPPPPWWGGSTPYFRLRFFNNLKRTCKWTPPTMVGGGQLHLLNSGKYQMIFRKIIFMEILRLTML